VCRGRELVAARYALARSSTASVRCVEDWAGPKSKADTPFKLGKANVRGTDVVRFQDFAPLLLASEDSIRALNETMGTQSYPIVSFRPNVIVKGTGSPWVRRHSARATVTAPA